MGRCIVHLAGYVADNTAYGLLIILAWALLSAGCVHNERYSPQESSPPLPPNPITEPHQDILEPPANEQSPAPTMTLTLDRAIGEALEASPELDQIASRMGVAAEQVRQAEASFYPRLTVGEEFNTTDNPVFALMYIINQRRLQSNVNFNDPGQQQNFASRVQGEWALFEGGSRWHDRKAALGQRDAVKAELQRFRNQLVAKVTETFYRWLNALAFIGVAERSLESAKTDERLAEARVHAQTALPSEVLRFKVRTLEAHENLIATRTGARRLQAGLERLLARTIRPEEVPDPARIVSSPSQDENTSHDPDSLVQKALARRPEMEAVRSLIHSAREKVKSSRGALLPRIGAGAQYEWDSEDLGHSAESWMVGVQATWLLFEGGLSVSKIREARSRLKEMEAQGEQVALDIALEVQQAVLVVLESSEKVQVAEERRKWAEKSLEEVRHLYRNQVAGVDSLLQAEVAWNQAEVSYSSALFEARVAQALLSKSLGDFALVEGRE